MIIWLIVVRGCQGTIECASPLFQSRKVRHLSLFQLKEEKSLEGMKRNRRREERRVSGHDDDHSDDHGAHGHDTEGPKVLYFFCIGLLLGSVTSYLLPRLKSKIPYTVVMFVEGVIIAVIYMNFDNGKWCLLSVVCCLLI